MFFKHFDSKNQLPGLSISGTLVTKDLITKLKVLQDKNRSTDVAFPTAYYRLCQKEQQTLLISKISISKQVHILQIYFRKHDGIRM